LFRGDFRLIWRKGGACLQLTSASSGKPDGRTLAMTVSELSASLACHHCRPISATTVNADSRFRGNAGKAPRTASRDCQ
jgi:hypothetical protein